MTTPAHLVLNGLVLGQGRFQAAWLPVTLGALMPDLPMLGFYAYQRVFLGTPESVIWADAYFRPSWQLLFDLFNSIPLLALAALLAWRAGATPALAFLLSMLLHCLADLPLHNDDAHAHFRPLSDWRFRSPISYWDPRYYGRIAAGLELVFVAVGGGLLALRAQTRAWRWVGGLTLAVYAAFLVFALAVWLAPEA